MHYSKLSRARVNVGLTTSQMAPKMGYSDDAGVSKFERGIFKKVPRSKVEAFARNTGLSYRKVKQLLAEVGTEVEDDRPRRAA